MRLLLLLALFAPPASGWWCEGHEVIALIASQNLSPAARSAVTALLTSQPIDPELQRFCKTRPADLMADASTWADDAKKAEQTGRWHYMDLPLGMKSGDPEQFCEPVGPSNNGQERAGCVLSALRYNLNILHDDKESDAERAKALRYLIHLVGDVHQPLHTTANNDQGGNCSPVQFFSDAKITNLHSVWDGMLFNRDLARDGLSLESIASDLERRFAGKKKSWTRDGIQFQKWVLEGHKLAQSVTYGNLTPKIHVEPFDPKPVCKAEAEKNAALHLQIDESYYQKAAPVMEEQLAKAGFRLAEVLNSVWP